MKPKTAVWRNQVVVFGNNVPYLALGILLNIKQYAKNLSAISNSIILPAKVNKLRKGWGDRRDGII